MKPAQYSPNSSTRTYSAVLFVDHKLDGGIWKDSEHCRRVSLEQTTGSSCLVNVPSSLENTGQSACCCIEIINTVVRHLPKMPVGKNLGSIKDSSGSNAPIHALTVQSRLHLQVKCLLLHFFLPQSNPSILSSLSRVELIAWHRLT